MENAVTFGHLHTDPLLQMSTANMRGNSRGDGLALIAYTEKVAQGLFTPINL